jgi:hypothetical protein
MIRPPDLMDDRRRRRRRDLIGIAGLALGVVALVVAILLIFPKLIIPDYDGEELREMNPSERTKAISDRLQRQNEARATLLQGVTGIAVVFGAFLTWRQINVGREGQSTDRFVQAIGQLGSDQIS